MVVLSLQGPTNLFLTSHNRHPRTKPVGSLPYPPVTAAAPVPAPLPERTRALTSLEKVSRRSNLVKFKEKEVKERKEETNRKIASQKAISIILRREATKAVIDNKKGNSKKLLPRTVLEALHERITALRWDSALKAKKCKQSKCAICGQPGHNRLTCQTEVAKIYRFAMFTHLRSLQRDM